MKFEHDLLGERLAEKQPRWRCLPCPGSYPAAKVPLPAIPPAKSGTRRVRVVDSFAGGGGASNGIRLALEQLHSQDLLPVGHPLDVDFAVDHDDAALCMHAANHPDTIHLPANVWQVSMRETLGDDLFGLLWLSPDCRDHSSAKSGPITSRAVRDLAWVAIKWIKELPDWQRPWIICLENVSAFAKWSPLIDRPDGKGLMRDPDRIGWTFHQFVHALSRFGYSIGWKELVACEYGDPTIRKRLKLVARRDGQPVEWPEPTHGDPKSEAVQAGVLEPWPVAADILDWSLDWSLDCPSIFLTKEEAREYTKHTGKRIIRPLAAKTDARLAYGVKRHVLDAGDDAFIVERANAGAAVPHMMTMRNSGSPTSAANEPTRTVMAGGANHQNQIVVPYLVPRYGERDGQAPRSVGIGRPAPTPVPDGNQGSLAAVYLAQHNTGEEGHTPRRPLSTIVGKGSTQGVVAVSMLSLKGSDRRDGSCKDPHFAVCASGQHSAVVTLPLMTAYYSTGGQHARIDSPSLTVPTKARFGLTEADAAVPPLTEAQWARARQVAAFLRAHGCWDGGEIVTLSIRGTMFVIVDIGMRMLFPRELARAQGFPDSYILAPMFKGKPLSETEQRHKIGNSVCEKPAAAVIVANYRPPLEWGEQTAPFMEAAE